MLSGSSTSPPAVTKVEGLPPAPSPGASVPKRSRGTCSRGRAKLLGSELPRVQARVEASPSAPRMRARQACQRHHAPLQPFRSAPGKPSSTTTHL
eukprot:3484198-Pyramimonas_sp.AAC.1